MHRLQPPHVTDRKNCDFPQKLQISNTFDLSPQTPLQCQVLSEPVLAERKTRDSFNYRLIVNLKAPFYHAGYTQQN